jgi:hypothetical protein
MASRRLFYDPGAHTPDGKVTFRLDLTGAVGEGDIQSELLPIFYSLHPALDNESGRLKQQPDVRSLLPLGPEFVLTNPDEQGDSHLGGIRIPASSTEQFVRKLLALGWIVET